MPHVYAGPYPTFLLRHSFELSLCIAQAPKRQEVLQVGVEGGGTLHEEEQRVAGGKGG